MKQTLTAKEVNRLETNPDALLANERRWATDRLKRDSNPGQLDPLHHPDPSTLSDLPEAWLLPSLTQTIDPPTGK